VSGYVGLLGAFLVLAVSGVVLAAALHETRQARQALDHRIGLLAASQPRTEPEEPSWRVWFGRFNSSIRRLFAFRIAKRWGMTASALTLTGLGLAAAGVAEASFGLWFGLPPLIVLPLAAAAFFGAPRVLLRRQQTRAETEFLTLFPDAVDMIVRMLRAGLPISGTIRTVAQEAARPVDLLFTEITDQLAIGVDFDEVLASASRRVGLADFSFFAAAVTLQRSTGGNLAATLESLAQIIRRRRAARLKAHAATAEVRLSAIVLGAMPVIVTGLLLLLNPHYLAPLITDPRGKFIVALAIVLLILGFVSMQRLMRSVDSA